MLSSMQHKAAQQACHRLRYWVLKYYPTRSALDRDNMRRLLASLDRIHVEIWNHHKEPS